jgi:hypothetical protein
MNWLRIASHDAGTPAEWSTHSAGLDMRQGLALAGSKSATGGGGYDRT